MQLDQLRENIKLKEMILLSEKDVLTKTKTRKWVKLAHVMKTCKLQHLGGGGWGSKL